MGAFEQLLETWRSNPASDSTLALCSYLSQYPREDLVREVGARAEQWHSSDAAVMLAVGRMYLEATLLAEAQAALVMAGKANPRDAQPFRFLGEVLLRRGDAIRGEKVLARAMELGSTDQETRLWHDRAVVYVALQKRVGAPAVAAEVARTLPQRSSVPAPPMPGAAAPAAAAEPPHWTGEEPPTIPKAPPARVPTGARPPAGGAPGLRPRSVPPPLPPNAPGPRQAPGIPPAPAVPSPPAQMMASGAAAAAMPAPAPAMPPPPSAPPLAVAPSPPARAPSFSDDSAPTTLQNKPPEPPLPSFGSSASAPAFGSGTSAPAFGSGASAPAFGSAAPAFGSGASAPAFGSGTSAPAHGSSASAPAFRPPQVSTADEFVDIANPSPEIVLEHLARVGVYEPGGGAPPAWEKASAPRTRGSWVLVLATVLFLGAGGGAYAYARHVKLQRMELAQHLNDEVDTLLHSANVDDLRSTDDKIARILDLDSRNKRAARLWLENRVLGALMLPEEPRGIDSAVHRAGVAEVPEVETAFGRIASFLVEGDLAGAAALLPKWDKTAGNDAFYQLTAAAALERAGDIRAIERYQAARERDAKLVLADILLARLVLLEAGPEKGKPLVESARKKAGDTPNTRALSALLWAVNPQREKEPPKDARVGPEDEKNLILPLRPVPYVAEALTAINAGQTDKATKAIDTAIGLTVSPAMATRLGFLAIQAGDEKLARKAALRALQFSALYPQARVLASRVALLGGRLDEAKKAIEELDPRSPEVAVVRAALAYETLDAGEMQTAVEAMGDAQKRPEMAALVAGPSVLTGREYPAPEALEQMARPQVPWGDLVAMDSALDTGNAELAETLVKQWGKGASRPVYALRVARLLRYQNKPEDAAKAGNIAFGKGTTTVNVVIEHVYDLLKNDDAKTARDVIAKYPALLGPLGNWLRMLVDGSSGHVAEAKVKAGQMELPPEGSPLVIRVLAARALAVAKDKRAKAYVQALAKRYPKHGDVLEALQAVK